MAWPVDLFTPSRRVSSASVIDASGRWANSAMVATTRSVGGDVLGMRKVSPERSNIATIVLHICDVRRCTERSRPDRGVPPMHELVIRGGTLVDGTGVDARPADVAVD